jgi:hypothetical protein
MKFVTTLFLLFMVSFAHSQTLSASRRVDWTVAGLNDTSTIGFTHLNATSFGMIGDGVSPNDQVFDSLLALNYPNGVHFYFPAGTYVFNQTKTLPSNCWISGDGAGATHFTFDLNGTGHALQSSGQVVSGDSSSFSTAGNKGDHFIRVLNTAQFQAGDWVKFQMEDADWVTSSWALKSVGQIVKISSIANDTLYLASELRMDYPLNRFPKAIRLNMKRNIGISCLSIERMDNTAPEQASNVQFSYVENAWIHGVESSKTTFAHFECEHASNVLVSNCYLHDAFDYGGGGRGYGVVLHFTTNECLIENNVFKHLRHSVLLQAGSNGNVTAFNHSLDPYWTNGNPLLSGNSAGELVLHGNYVYANLFEHNVVQNIVIDNSHGPNGPYNTFLRNRAELYGIFFSDATSPSQNFLGNEVTNANFPYSAVNYSIQGVDQFSYGNNNKGTVSPAGTSNLMDTSYHYQTKPGFVQGYQWGKIGLPNAMNAEGIPAKDRFEANEVFAGACGSEDFYANIAVVETGRLGVYPNPCKDFVTIRSDEQMESLTVYGFRGEILQSVNHLNAKQSTLDVSYLKEGFYIITVRLPNGTVKSEKLIVHPNHP